LCEAIIFDGNSGGRFLDSGFATVRDELVFRDAVGCTVPEKRKRFFIISELQRHYSCYFNTDGQWTNFIFNKEKDWLRG
jgi:hypothetical protein